MTTDTTAYIVCDSTATVGNVAYIACDKRRGHDGPHCWSFAWEQVKSPAVPAWRALVEEMHGQVFDEFKQPGLPSVLSDLMVLAQSSRPDPDHLASIIAICEREVGSGWQADPGRQPDTGLCTAWELLGCFTGNQDGYTQPRDEDWRVLGDSAVCWLAALTEGQDQ